MAILSLFCAPLFAAAPVFLGATTDYITNSGGRISFVYSNRVRVVFDRGNSTMRITNNIAGQSLVINAGTIDEGAAIRQEYSFGTSQALVPGYIWGFTLTTNGFIMGDGAGNLFLNGTRTDNTLQFPSMTSFPSGSNAVNRLTLTNGVGDIIATATRTGGALTNITLNAQGPRVIHVDGSTNVNIVALMNWVAGLQRPVTLLITNRTATVRTVSLGATTNNWVGMGSITGPIQNTNALWIAFENLGTSNVVYAAQYMANPTN